MKRCASASLAAALLASGYAARADAPRRRGRAARDDRFRGPRDQAAASRPQCARVYPGGRVYSAKLAGGEGALDSYLTAGNDLIAASTQPPVAWVKGKAYTRGAP